MFNAIKEKMVTINETCKLTNLIQPIIKENRNPSGLEYLRYNTMKSAFATAVFTKDYPMKTYEALYGNYRTLDDFIKTAKENM